MPLALHLYSRRSSALLVVSVSILVVLSLHLVLSSESLVTSLKASPWHHGTPHDTALRYDADDLPVVADQQPGHEDKILGLFSQVLVVSRPGRFDRRATMERLRLALGVPFTYVDAISHDEPVIETIMGCVQLIRDNSQSRVFQWPPDPILGANVGSLFEGLPCFQRRVAVALQATSPALVSTSILDVPTTVTLDSRDAAFARPSAIALTCALEDHTLGVEYTSTLSPHMLLTPAKIACWHSHLTAIRRVFASGVQLSSVNNRDPVLILEDDVDMEQDISKKLRTVWGLLPSDWDIVFLGHCWSDEAHYPAVPGQNEARADPKQVVLHPSYAPKCTHAYAINPASARRLLLHLSFPPFAYSRALDQALAWLVQSKRIKAYSVVPSVVIQHKGSGSDIDQGTDGLGSGWRDHLVHGILGL
ncbi:hypothetical protein C2E23DRAFT_834642 [Lenzites betulinus]|nr:hypothetical protein C2E23DRAFT_834642 [Lenzites betulinus]